MQVAGCATAPPKRREGSMLWIHSEMKVGLWTSCYVRVGYNSLQLRKGGLQQQIPRTESPRTSLLAQRQDCDKWYLTPFVLNPPSMQNMPVRQLRYTSFDVSHVNGAGKGAPEHMQLKLLGIELWVTLIACALECGYKTECSSLSTHDLLSWELKLFWEIRHVSTGVGSPPAKGAQERTDELLTYSTCMDYFFLVAEAGGCLLVLLETEEYCCSSLT